MATQITATLPTLDFPREVDYPTQEDWAAFSAAAEENFGILGGNWSTQMQLWKDQANAMSIESNTNATIAQGLANYQGDWTSQGYILGQTVSIGGVYYICKLTHATGQNPTAVGSLYWNLALGNWNLKVDTNMSGYTSKSTPVDADLIPLSDSGASFGIKKLSWANLKTTLFDGAFSFSSNGYLKLPTVMGGFIFQWGQLSSVGNGHVFIFPTAFNVGPGVILTTHMGGSSQGTSGSTTQFTLNTPVATANPCQWFTIGR